MDKATITAMLAEATQAYHELLTGRQTVSITDQTGERVQYNVADRNDLQKYIQELTKMLATGDTVFDPQPACPPIRFLF